MNRIVFAALILTASLSVVPGAYPAETSGANMTVTEGTGTFDAAAINANLSYGAEEKVKESVRSTWPLVVPKELMRMVPAGEREEFLSRMVLVNGAVAEVQNGILRKYFKGGDFNSVLNAMLPAPEDEDLYYHETPSRYVHMDTLLKEVPLLVRGEFLDDLAFENGHLVSAYVGGLKKILSRHDLETLLNMLACDSRKMPAAAGGKTVCGAGWCINSVCHASRPVPGGHSEDIVCFSSCRLYR